MKTTTLLAASLAVGSTGAFAGGMDRSGQSIAPIFETGTYVELSFGSISPDVTGTSPVYGYSGDMAPSYTQLSGAYKRDLTDALSMAIIIDQPYGADVDYGDAEAGYLLENSTATVDTVGVTAILRYKLGNGFSVHGGVRNLSSSGEVSLPFLTYSMETSDENDWSWLAGVAYEIPDIALRASLTYHSETTIDFDVTESSIPLGTNVSQMEVVMPKSVNFDFQTGIAADTLLMFSARWAEWTETVIDPNDYNALTGGGILVDHNGDTTSYSLGIGRRFNDKWSGSVAIGYEDGTGGLSGNLSPRDGYTSLTVGAKYQITEQTAISGGVSYVWLGDASTSILSEFEDNTAIGVGLKLSHHF
ncbi:OmpP1/FadL family transporter [Celeribacter naphthalenivorans]|uniref:OmpP1/FadL family transporter n=1 Tax=Celeribacter naphthalenivorans TaxID=1614694 RepID=UPI001CF95CA3|nr:outer membrane protein transport protein [Celeribacter naphthalenivorans]